MSSPSGHFCLRYVAVKNNKSKEQRYQMLWFHLSKEAGTKSDQLMSVMNFMFLFSHSLCSSFLMRAPKPVRISVLCVLEE